MITRIDYESMDGKRIAWIVRISERQWFVGRAQRIDGNPHLKHRRIAKSLTSAQGMARTWVGR